MAKVYLNTVCIEQNRWQKPKKFPSYKVSDWIGRMAEDGFDGIELWEHHALQADEEELQKLKSSSIPVEIYNSYVNFANEFEEGRQMAANMITKLGVQGVKFNLGNDLSRKDEYIANLKEWEKQLPDSCQLICECHPGTIMEEQNMAAKIFEELGSDRYEAIVHPFKSDDISDLRAWFDHLGSTITHAHCSLNRDKVFHKLDNHRNFVKANLELMDKAGFAGTYSMEFTAGVGLEEETMELVYRNAVEDMILIRNLLSEIKK